MFAHMKRQRYIKQIISLCNSQITDIYTLSGKIYIEHDKYNICREQDILLTINDLYEELYNNYIMSDPSWWKNKKAKTLHHDIGTILKQQYTYYQKDVSQTIRTEFNNVYQCHHAITKLWNKLERLLYINRKQTSHQKK